MTSAVGPIICTSPRSNSRLRWHRFATARRLWETKTTVAPLAITEFIRSTHLTLEEVVSNAEHLIDKQNVRIDMGRNRKTETGVHARRVPLDRSIDELLEPREGDDVIEAPANLIPRHA